MMASKDALTSHRPHRVLVSGWTLFAALGLGGCDRPPTNTYRYRLTIDVMTPQGLRSGSSVIEVKTVASNGLQGGAVQSKIRGEAVMVDLPNGKTLFALLDRAGEVAPGTLLRHSGIAPATGKEYLESLDFMKKIGGQSDVPEDLEERRTAQGTPRLWPTFVYFSDIHDPKSVMKIAPERFDELGSGYKLSKIKVKISDDNVTQLIQKKLPWLSEYRGVMLDGSKYNDGSSEANALSSELFLAGDR